ncbi:unnamed protein product [Durusdinium trenchii]|uniref:Uncharacterized protein n=1 Tax=Durusdinium trenchii TaxID=1381693 RepID=A0ABP0NFM9_9DINO|eukprot:g28677.t1
MQILLATVVLAILGAAEGGGYTSLSRRLQEDNVTFVPLPPKIEYPIDPAAMIAGAFVGALGVPFLFGIWAFFERRKPRGGAFEVFRGETE